MQDLLFLPDLRVIEEPQIIEDDMLFKVEAISPPSHCPHCGTVANLYKHGSRKQKVMDLPIRFKRVALIIKRRRYLCRDCGTAFWEDIESLDDRRSMTYRLMVSIEEQAMSKTFVEVAESVGVDEKTVRNVFRECIAIKESEHRFETPKWLGIDEIHIIRRPRLVLTDVENNTIFDLRPNRNKETVINRLMEIPGRHEIEYVTMDMWAPYRDAVKIALPQAKVVVDKFHVVRMANQALDSVRKSLKDSLSKKERRTLMRERFILLKRKHDLGERELFLLDTWLGNFPDLKEAHELKEDFYCIWDTSGSYEARERYIKWRERCLSSNSKSAYSDLVRAVDNWHVEIFNYFDKKLTNAYTESINSIIRQVERMGRGYSFEALRAKILFNGKLHQKRKARFDSSKFMFNYNMSMFGGSSGSAPERDIIINHGVDFSTLLEALEKGEL